MDQLKTLQEFIVAWMDELWYSMRDRVGALSIIESLQNSWRVAGRKIGEIAKDEGLSFIETVEMGHRIFGRPVTIERGTVVATACPIWDRILAGSLEYGLRCEEFICAPFISGMKEALGAKEAVVETNLRLAHIKRVGIEYKLSKLAVDESDDPSRKKERQNLQEQLDALPKIPACVFRVK